MDLRTYLLQGHVIPAHPLALDAERRLDERAQRALTRYYLAAGAGGIAVGVHTTQFAIRDPKHGLYEPVLALAAETVRVAGREARRARGAPPEIQGPAPRAREHHRRNPSGGESPRPALIAGIVGRTDQALREARIATDLGYHAGLLSLGAWRDDREDAILHHCRAVAEAIPLFGFYLQPAVGGRVLSYAFWRAFAQIPGVVAIKVAPFNRYQTLDVVRALADVGRRDVALYTGNDDSIVADLLTPFPAAGGAPVRFAGGLLGHWAVWTRAAVLMLDEVQRVRHAEALDAVWLRRAAEVTDMNGAVFDVRNAFAGCIAGVHEVLRRQGLMRGTWCLDPCETLSPGQREEIDRVASAYPHLTDDAFVAEHRHEWMR